MESVNKLVHQRGDICLLYDKDVNQALELKINKKRCGVRQ